MTFNDSKRIPDSSQENHRLRMLNQKAISQKEIDSRWFSAVGEMGADTQAQASAHIERQAPRPLTFLRTHRLALFLSRPLFFFLFLSSLRPFVSLASLYLSISLPFSPALVPALLFYVLLAFIIKIKCKIVPREDEFSERYKTASSLLSFSLFLFAYIITILVEGSVLRFPIALFLLVLY